MVFEEELRASGSCDREVVAHMVEAVIFNNGQPKEDIDYFWMMLKQTEEVLHNQLAVMEKLNE